MSVLNNTGILAGASGADTGYNLKRSTRFNDDDSAYLNWTPTSAGDRQTWTWSSWVKRHDLTVNQRLFTAGSSGTNCSIIEFLPNGDLEISNYHSGYNCQKNTTMLFRDPSAWFHLVVKCTASTLQVYVNGVEVTDWDTDTDPDGTDWEFNESSISHTIGKTAWGSEYLNASLADVHMIDGTALDHTSFGEPDATTGQWVPKEYTGTYGTNGFHLAMDPAETGTTYSDDITGSGSYTQFTNLATNARRAFDGDTSTVCWADSATGSNTGGDITWTPSSSISVSSLKIYGAYHNNGVFKINGNTINSQLTSGSNGWRTITGITSISNISIHATSGSDTCSWGAIEVNGKILVDHTAFGHDSSGEKNHWHENNLVVAAAGTVWSSTLTNSHNGWSSGQGATQAFNGVAAGSTDMAQANATGGTMTWTFSGLGLSGSVRVWIGNVGATVTDGNSPSVTRGTSSASGWLSLSGVITDYNNSITITPAADHPSLGAVEVAGSILIDGTVPIDVDLLADVPGAPYDNGANGGANYATLNPLDSGGTLSNGNLDVIGGGGDWKSSRATFAMPSGKWYFEYTVNVDTYAHSVGIGTDSPDLLGYFAGYSGGYAYHSSGGKYNNNSSSSYGNSWLSTGNIIGVAFDADNGDLYFYKNGVVQDSGTAAFTGLTSETYFPIISNNDNLSSGSMNFGQRPFLYPVSGYNALNTFNLAPPLIDDPSKHIDVATDTGANILNTAKGLTDGADFVWIKDRDNNSTNHSLFNRINNSNMDGDPHLRSNEVDDEATCGAYSAPTGSSVAWVWNAGDAANPTSVSVGSLNNSVYNPDSTWSSTLTNSHNGWSSGQGATQAFNGVAAGSTDMAQANATGGTMTWTFSGLGLSGSVRVWIGNVGAAVTDAYGATRGTNVGGSGWLSLSGNIADYGNSITITPAADAPSLGAVEVAGKMLVDSSVTPPDVPSIASEYKANTATGFSIVSYTGVGNTVSTVGTGLNAVPSLIIVKDRDDANDWAVYHSALGATKDLCLNSYGGENTRLMWNDTAPTSSVFTIGAGNNADYRNRVNDTNDYIALVWSEVEGYSKFGSYVGNNGDNFIYLGFRARWVMTKSSSNNYAHWNIVDTARGPYNRATEVLAASNANTTLDNSVTGFDICSNGITLKPDANGQHNYNNVTFVYAAFAETPFKYSNAR